MRNYFITFIALIGHVHWQIWHFVHLALTSGKFTSSSAPTGQTATQPPHFKHFVLSRFHVMGFTSYGKHKKA
jgi:hypothetical protein